MKFSNARKPKDCLKYKSDSIDCAKDCPYYMDSCNGNENEQPELRTH